MIATQVMVDCVVVETGRSGPIAAYSFDEGSGAIAVDSSGHGNDGLISDAAWTDGRSGNALLFDGATSRVTVPHADKLGISAALTIEAWVQPYSSGGGQGLVVVKERDDGLAYSLYSQGNAGPGAQVAVNESGSDVLAEALAGIPLSAWTHLAMTYDGDFLRLFVDGAQVQSTGAAGLIQMSEEPLLIGGSTVWPADSFHGLIDEVRIYDRALSAEEIQANMETPVEPPATPTATPTPTSTPRPTATATVPPTSTATPTATRTPTATIPPPTATTTPAPTATNTPAPTSTPASIEAQIGKWSPAMNWPLVAVHTSLLPNGELLIWDAWELPSSKARLWNPSTNVFTNVFNPWGLFCAAHSSLADGRLLVTGGHAGGEIGIRQTNIFNPVTRSWETAPDMGVERWYPSSTTLGDGRVVVISGQLVHGVFADIPEVYNPATNSWSFLSNVNTGDMHDPEYPLAFLAPDGRILVVAATPGIARVLDVNAQTWTALPNMPQRFGSAAMYRPGQVLYTGGGNGGRNVPSQTDASVINMNDANPSWRQIAPMAYPRYQHNLVTLADGNVLAVGGSTTLSLTSHSGTLPAEMWNPDTEQWTTMASMRDPRMYHSTALLLPDGRVLAAGGGQLDEGGQAAINYYTAEIYSPPYLFKGPRPTISSAPATAAYGATIPVHSPDAKSITSVAFIGLASNTHTVDMNQRYVEVPFTRSGSTLNVQTPSNANVMPPGYYMLVIKNGEGVPSVATNVRVGSASADGEPPSVSVTSPSNGATVSGTVALTADALDNVGVYGVQFMVNGANVGAFDTTPPYSRTWSSATVPNGQHTITARAIDTSGNETVSAPVTVTVQNETMVPGSLVAAYGFNEGGGSNVADSSGHGNHGTLSGGVGWTSSGRYGSALSFDGQSGIVSVPDSASLDLTTGMTISAWVRPSSLSGWKSIIMKERPGQLAYALFGNTGSNRPSVEVKPAASQWNESVPGTWQLSLNTWTHLAGTYDGSVLRLYVNGTLVSSKSVSGALQTSSNPLQIGGSTVWSDEFFHGRIDEVRIYDRGLTASEITSDMNTPLP
jgi:hypothetical protein